MHAEGMKLKAMARQLCRGGHQLKSMPIGTYQFLMSSALAASDLRENPHSLRTERDDDHSHSSGSPSAL